jgi:excisionase family DNA binding protein
MPSLTTREAAEILGVSPRRVQALIKAERLPAVKFGHVWVIDERDLELVKRRTPGNPNWK